jgi:peptidoglycan/xylan/chitin deacetylase (PgdA/CDA1 family)
VRGIRLHPAVPRRGHAEPVDPFLGDAHNLTRQVAALRNQARVMPLDDVLDHLAEGAPLPAGAVHLSIDDGFAGTMTAAEVLDDHRLPWTLFVSVEAVLDGRPPWFVRIADALWCSHNILGDDGTLHDVSDREGKDRFLHAAMTLVLDAPGDARDDVVDGLLALPGMAHPDGTRWPFLGPAELRQLAGAGVTIGSHGATHVDLTNTSDPELEREVTAHRRLADVIGAPVRYFSYPHGRHDRRTRAAVAGEHDLAVAGPSVPWSVTRLVQPRHDAGTDRRGLDVALHGGRAPLGAARRRAAAARVDGRRLVVSRGDARRGPVVR